MLELLTLLRYAAPVGLAAIGETVGQKAGVINIGLEGMMLGGAYAAMATALATGSPWLGIVAGIVCALCLSGISALFCLWLNVDQVVVGTALNLLVLGLTGTLFRARFGQSGQLLSLPEIPIWHGLDPIIVGMVVLAIGAWFVLARTGWGLALRSAGEYPKATEAAGFPVRPLRLQAMLLGGAFAGLAGAYLCLGVAASFAENMTAGRGFIAIALVTFGRWKPFYVFLAALLIGVVETLQYRFQAFDIDIPFQVMLALPYLVALLVLVVVGKGMAAPAALGQPYQTER